MRPSLRLFVLAAALTSSLPAGDQLPGPAPAARLISLNVVALDSRGQPVEDLTSNDFQVSDAGKPQKIAFFRHNDTGLQASHPLAPNEFSNRAGSNVPHATLILFDLMNEHFSARGMAWNELVHALESLESSDFLYLYLLTVDGQLYPVHGLPGPETDAAQKPAAPWAREAKPLLDDAMRVVSRLKPYDFDVDTRVRITFGTLETLAARLVAVPGRKNIVWVTHGIPISIDPRYTWNGEWIDYAPRLQQLSVTLDRSNVAIYPVQQVPPGTAIPGSPESQYTGLGSQETLQQFAGLTGGRSKSSNDIGAAVRQSMNDVRTSYQVGYYPPAGNWDGKYHKLRVTSARKGIRIQTKLGYYAWPEAAASDEQEILNAAISASFDAAEIGLRGTFLRAANNARGGEVLVHVDPADILLGHEGELYTADLRIAVVGYDAEGKMQGSRIVPLNLRMSQEQRDKAATEGIPLVQQVTFGPSVKRVRYLVFDRGTTAVGSVTVPVMPDYELR